MTAADKLRELLATRPAMPDAVQLVRWWRATGGLIPVVLDALDALRARVAELEQGSANWERLQLQTIRQHRTDIEGFESALAQEVHEKSILEQVERELRAELEATRAELVTAMRTIEAAADNEARDQPPALAGSVDELEAHLDASEPRCAKCGAPFAKSAAEGCVPTRCDVHERALRNGMPPSGRWA